ncbi:hypothetical protein FHX80_12611 [Streptomyces brevispora]|uniref:Uncharacterized protein n=1 Tax=Streptomyces brevispora TaxID=887462 RepID=A0A561TYV2_9ACTN|nr:hypothetical protein FHX80_12611 [Streptomyces brevispora]
MLSSAAAEYMASLAAALTLAIAHGIRRRIRQRADRAPSEPVGSVTAEPDSRSR